MAIAQGAVAQVAVAALPPPPSQSGPEINPGTDIKPIVMNFGAGVRRIEVQGY